MWGTQWNPCSCPQCRSILSSTRWPGDEHQPGWSPGRASEMLPWSPAWPFSAQECQSDGTCHTWKTKRLERITLKNNLLYMLVSSNSVICNNFKGLYNRTTPMFPFTSGCDGQHDSWNEPNNKRKWSMLTNKTIDQLCILLLCWGGGGGEWFRLKCAKSAWHFEPKISTSRIQNPFTKCSPFLISMQNRMFLLTDLCISTNDSQP